MKRRRKPHVYASLNNRGEIALSAEAFRRIKESWNVALVCDPAQRTIGIRCPVPREGDLYFVRPYGRGGRMRVISAVRLLKQFDIKIEQTLKFHAPPLIHFNGEPMLVLELDKAESSARRPSENLNERR